MSSPAIPYSDEYDRNYYAAPQIDAEGLRYRLEGHEIVERVVDTLRGGAYEDGNGRKVYRETHRLMNEEGIARVEMFLSGAVNKVVHLTKYKNEDRILRQVLEMARAFLFEQTANMKRWGPWFTASVPREELEEWARKTGVLQQKILEDDGETCKVHYQVKVRNKYLVLQVMENSLLAAMQRGIDGFEAGNTIKSWNVHEAIGQRGEGDGQPRQNFLSRFNLFSRGGGDGA